MISLNRTTRVFLKTGATDLRKSFDGLYALVKTQLLQDPNSGHLFVFCNQSRTRIRILTFDGTGLWVCTKRLERGTYAWTKDGKSEIDPAELHALLAGLEVESRRGWYRHPRPGAAPAPEGATQPSGSVLPAAALSAAA